MKITIKITCDNEAFADNPGGEVARILRQYADRIDGMEPEDVILMDSNGNRVGSVEILD